MVKVPSPLRDDVTLLGDALMTAGATIRRAGGTMIGGAMILRDGAMILRDGAMMIGGAMFHHAKFPIVSVVTLRRDLGILVTPFDRVEIIQTCLVEANVLQQVQERVYIVHLASFWEDIEDM